MTGSGSTLQSFYEAVAARDLASAGRYLADDLVFSGLFETYRGPNEYLTALIKLLQVTLRLDVRKIVSQGADAVILFELETKAPVECTTLVTEWHQVVDGKININEGYSDARHSTFCSNRSKTRNRLSPGGNRKGIQSLVGHGHYGEGRSR
jgi:hypothetical protein